VQQALELLLLLSLLLKSCVDSGRCQMLMKTCVVARVRDAVATHIMHVVCCCRTATAVFSSPSLQTHQGSVPPLHNNWGMVICSSCHMVLQLCCLHPPDDSSQDPQQQRHQVAHTRRHQAFRQELKAASIHTPGATAAEGLLMWNPTFPASVCNTFCL
jgi:hypothetical protein